MTIQETAQELSTPLITNVTTEEVWRIIARADVSNAPPLAPRHGRQRQCSFRPAHITTIYGPNEIDGWRIERTIVEGFRLTQRDNPTSRRVEDYFEPTDLGGADQWIREFTIGNRPQLGGRRRAAS